MSDLAIEWLTSSVGKNLIEEAGKFKDTLSATSALRARYPELDSELIRQAITQSILKSKAPLSTPGHFLLTDEGLQQATRPQVANYRAELLREKFGRLKILDLSCGLGFDSYFLALAGHEVMAIERDEEISRIATHNLQAVGVPVICADANNFEIPNDVQLVFVDPARRDPKGAKNILGQAKRISDPESWSPNWSFVKQLSHRFTVVAKLAPGFDAELIEDWDAYWVSVDGDLVETMLISSDSHARFAVLLKDETSQLIEGGALTRVQDLGKYLVIPNSALIRASALNYLATKLDAGLVNEHIAWLTTESPLATTFHEPSAQILEILQVAKFNEKDLAKQISAYAPGALTITTRGINLDPELLRKKLLKKPIKSGPEIVLAIYRDDAGTVALICKRLPKAA